MLVIKQQHKALVISENKLVTKIGEEKSETKETEQIISREMKRKTEKDHSGPGYVTPPKYLKKVLPWGRMNKEPTAALPMHANFICKPKKLVYHLKQSLK